MNTYSFLITFYSGEIFEGEAEGRASVDALIAFLHMYEDELREKNIKTLIVHHLL